MTDNLQNSIRQILDSQKLSQRDKIDQLMSLKYDMIERLVASEEGMGTTSKEASLGEIETALRKLNGASHFNGNTGTKHSS